MTLARFMVGVDALAKGVPGYVSSNIHLSRDGERNLNLVQFGSGRAVGLGLPRVLWRVTRGRSDASLKGGVPRVEGLGTPDIHLYEAVSVASRNAERDAIRPVSRGRRPALGRNRKRPGPESSGLGAQDDKVLGHRLRSAPCPDNLSPAMGRALCG